MTQKNETDKFAEELVLGFYKKVHIATFVRDIILYGSHRIVEVCDSHGVDAETFKQIMELPSFKKEMREIRALTEASPNALIQLKARAVVEQGIEDLAHIIKRGGRDSDKIKAMELLCKISGITEAGRIGSGDGDGKPQASGLVLNVNLGDPKGLIPPIPEGGHRPLRRVSDFTKNVEVIDV